MASRSISRLASYADPQFVGAVLRRRRSRVIKELIEECHRKLGRVRILDLGGTRTYWKIFDSEYLRARNVAITLVNVSAEASGNPESGMFTSIAGDACNLREFSDRSFDLVHSNSVIEHVGDWERVEAFAREVRRLGSSYYVQTPYFWFPFEPHYMTVMFHWWPESWRTKMLMRKRRGHHQRVSNLPDAIRDIRSIQLLDSAQMRHLFSDAEIKYEWLGPLPKSILAIRSSS